MGCSHTKDVPVLKTDVDCFGDETDTWEDEPMSTYVDIDIHRAQCSLCGHIIYYSGAARDFFEKGITSNVKGLEKPLM